MGEKAFRNKRGKVGSFMDSRCMWLPSHVRLRNQGSIGVSRDPLGIRRHHFKMVVLYLIRILTQVP